MSYPKRQFVLADAKTNVRVVNIDEMEIMM
jgi:hypothetical protein